MNASSEALEAVANYLPPDLSPLCRQEAFLALGSPLDCDDLSYEQQKDLALELTKCHLMELGKATFSTLCPFGDCIDKLTDHGIQCYTVFKTHVEQYCFKMTHDLYLRKHYELSHDFQETVKMASQKLLEVVQQQTEIKEVIMNQQAAIKNQHSELQEAANTASQVVSSLQEKQSELHLLLENFGTATHLLQPILSIDNSLIWISNGLEFFHLFVYGYVSLQAIWIFTIPRCVNSSRRVLIVITLLECLWQVVIQVGMKELDQWTRDVRNLCRLMQGVVFIISFFRYFCAQEEPVQQDEQSELIAAINYVKESTVVLQRRSEEREEQLFRELKKYHGVTKKILNENLPMIDNGNYAKAQRETLNVNYNSARQNTSLLGSTLLRDRSYKNSDNLSGASLPSHEAMRTQRVVSRFTNSGGFCSKDGILRRKRDDQSVIKKRRRKEEEFDLDTDSKPTKKIRTILLPWSKNA